MALLRRRRIRRRSCDQLPRAPDGDKGLPNLFECTLFDLAYTLACQANCVPGFFERGGPCSIKAKPHAHDPDVNRVKLAHEPADLGNVVGFLELDCGLICVDSGMLINKSWATLAVGRPRTDAACCRHGAVDEIEFAEGYMHSARHFLGGGCSPEGFLEFPKRFSPPSHAVLHVRWNMHWVADVFDGLLDCLSDPPCCIG